MSQTTRTILVLGACGIVIVGGAIANTKGDVMGISQDLLCVVGVGLGFLFVIAGAFYVSRHNKTDYVRDTTNELRDPPPMGNPSPKKSIARTQPMPLPAPQPIQNINVRVMIKRIFIINGWRQDNPDEAETKIIDQPQESDTELMCNECGKRPRMMFKGKLATRCSVCLQAAINKLLEQ